MKCLGVDTKSQARGRGYAIAENGVVLWKGKHPPRPELLEGVTVVAGERPWQAKGKQRKLTGENLITFSVNNGFQLRDAWTRVDLSVFRPMFVLIPVRVWKDTAIYGCAGMEGTVFCNNLRQKYMLDERDEDILDAGGIAVAASKMEMRQLQKYNPPGFKL